DRLAEPDIVGQQDARPETLQDGERRFELVREKFDVGARRRSKRARRGFGGEERAAGVPPSTTSDIARPFAPLDPVDIVEWREQPARRSRRRGALALQCEQPAIVVGSDVDDAPACLARADTLQNFHRPSARRAAESSAPGLRGTEESTTYRIAADDEPRRRKRYPGRWYGPRRHRRRWRCPPCCRNQPCRRDRPVHTLARTRRISPIVSLSSSPPLP